MESCRFIKVEEFFRDYKSWNTIDKVDSHTYDPGQRRLSLFFKNFDNMTCCMLLYFPRKDTVRVRFNPGKKEFPDANTRSVIMDTFTELSDTMKRLGKDFSAGYEEGKDSLEVTTRDNNDNPFMKLVVNLKPFKINIFRFDSEGKPFLVLADPDSGSSLYYQKRLINGKDTGDFSIIQCKMKPGPAKYIGFGEKGGASICQNTNQLTYFNYDNMKYEQVYNRGALDNREPLYDSNPFFMEFYGVPDQNSIYGIFVDNPSETYMDIGYLNSSRYMFGSIFYDLDYYILLADNCTDIMEAYTSFVGHARLKPRFILGYHQGCYGYDSRAKLEEVANKYRQNRIPIDGLHIDVDIQKNYQTFTIDETKFPNPREMFSKLKEKGFKCSTNITPIISNKDPNYRTYQSGMENQYFVKDIRCEPLPFEEEYYQDYKEGTEEKRFLKVLNLNDPNYNTGKPYIGEVWYGDDRGTTGHYPDFGKKDVREWWGRQYKSLFEMGLEMVWQDMTTPSIRNTRGDMRSFPFKLMLTDNFLTKFFHGH